MKKTLWLPVMIAQVSCGVFMSNAVEIIAHRGASYDAPENNLASFRLGYEHKADADEMDIHLTSDGKIVVIHDFNTRRTSGMTNKVVENHV